MMTPACFRTAGRIMSLHTKVRHAVCPDAMAPRSDTVLHHEDMMSSHPLQPLLAVLPCHIIAATCSV